MSSQEQHPGQAGSWPESRPKDEGGGTLAGASRGLPRIRLPPVESHAPPKRNERTFDRDSGI